jgi:Sec-independent protein secretion pathway component TatC
VAGWLQWRSRFAPCPIDPALAAACMRTRKLSLRVYLFSVGLFLIGLFFAYAAPYLNE